MNLRVVSLGQTLIYRSRIRVIPTLQSSIRSLSQAHLPPPETQRAMVLYSQSNYINDIINLCKSTLDINNILNKGEDIEPDKIINYAQSINVLLETNPKKDYSEELKVLSKSIILSLKKDLNTESLNYTELFKKYSDISTKNEDIYNKLFGKPHTGSFYIVPSKNDVTIGDLIKNNEDYYYKDFHIIMHTLYKPKELYNFALGHRSLSVVNDILSVLQKKDKLVDHCPELSKNVKSNLIKLSNTDKRVKECINSFGKLSSNLEKQIENVDKQKLENAIHNLDNILNGINETSKYKYDIEQFKKYLDWFNNNLESKILHKQKNNAEKMLEEVKSELNSSIIKLNSPPRQKLPETYFNLDKNLSSCDKSKIIDDLCINYEKISDNKISQLSITDNIKLFVNTKTGMEKDIIIISIENKQELYDLMNEVDKMYKGENKTFSTFIHVIHRFLQRVPKDNDNQQNALEVSGDDVNNIREYVKELIDAIYIIFDTQLTKFKSNDPLKFVINSRTYNLCPQVNVSPDKYNHKTYAIMFKDKDKWYELNISSDGDVMTFICKEKMTDDKIEKMTFILNQEDQP